MSEELKAAIIGAVVGSMSAGWLSYFISKAGIKATHRNALALLQQQEFSNASFFFINAFIEELNLLETTSKDAYVDILRPAFPKHKAAVYIFRQAISDTTERAAFDKAWEEYYKNEHQPSDPLRQYSTTLQQTDDFPRNKRRPLAITRIKALLEFAEKK